MVFNELISSGDLVKDSRRTSENCEKSAQCKFPVRLELENFISVDITYVT